jgi:hypothetical protein
VLLGLGRIVALYHRSSTSNQIYKENRYLLFSEATIRPNPSSYRPGLGEHPAEVYGRREPLYARCAGYRFSIATEETAFDEINADFARLVKYIVTAKQGQAARTIIRARIGLGRIVALYYHSSTLYQIH